MRISFAIDQGFHVYGLEWNQSVVGFYIDGAPVGKLPAACLTAPIGMDFDRETMPDWMGLPDPATLPDVPFEIDYVRAWKRTADVRSYARSPVPAQ
jgi:beta-glucanase (GH16 family)